LKTRTARVQRHKRRAGLARAAVVALVLAWSTSALAQRFAASISRAQIEIEFERMRAAHELRIDGPLAWTFTFSGADSAALEALSLRLVRDGYAIVSLHSDAGRTVLRVGRTELHTPASLERRGHELSALARGLGVPSYEGADVGPVR